MKKLITRSIMMFVLYVYLVTMISLTQVTNTYDKQTIKLREFDNLNELKTWLQYDNVNNNTYINDTYDCEDFAMDVVDNATRSGYLIYSMGSGTVVCQGDKFIQLINHAYCITKIDNIWYRIEPQTDEITKLGKEI